jgi:hypothetical protein
MFTWRTSGETSERCEERERQRVCTILPAQSHAAAGRRSFQSLSRPQQAAAGLAGPGRQEIAWIRDLPLVQPSPPSARSRALAVTRSHDNTDSRSRHRRRDDAAGGRHYDARASNCSGDGGSVRACQWSGCGCCSGDRVGCQRQRGGRGAAVLRVQ